MSNRNGKIAKLPLQIREELNTRLHEGEPAGRLVNWLNAQPCVISILEAKFEGRPVSNQNISEWRQGGYLEWLAIHKTLDDARAIFEGAAQSAAIGITSEHLLVALTARHAEMIQMIEFTPENVYMRRLAALERLTNCALALRKSELSAARLQLERERLEFHREKRRGDAASCPGNSAGGRFAESSSLPSSKTDGFETPDDSSPIAESLINTETSSSNSESLESESPSAPHSTPPHAPFAQRAISVNGKPAMHSEPPVHSTRDGKATPDFR